MRRIYADLGLLAVAIIWGATFPVVKIALNFISPLAFNSVRFLLTSSLFIPFLRLKEFKAGVIIGTATFFGYLFQTVGLLYTTSTNAGFITSTYVVLTPAIAYILFRERIESIDIISVILATLGIFLLSGVERFRVGDILMIFCAIAFAFEIVLIARYSKHMNVMSLAGWQVVTVGVFSLIPAFFTAEKFEFNTFVVFAIALTGLLATFFAKIMQNRMQRDTSPVDAGIILSMEGLFAHLFGMIFLSESLSLTQYGGVALLMTSFVLITAVKEYMTGIRGFHWHQ